MFNKTYSMSSLNKNRNKPQVLYRLASEKYEVNPYQSNLTKYNTNINNNAVINHKNRSYNISSQRNNSQKVLNCINTFEQIYCDHLIKENQNAKIIKNLIRDRSEFLKYYFCRNYIQNSQMKLKLINSNEFLNGIITGDKKANIKLPKLSFSENILFKNSPLLIKNAQLNKFYSNHENNPNTFSRQRKQINYLNNIHKTIVVKTAGKELDKMNRNNIFSFDDNEIKEEQKANFIKQENEK